MPSSTSMLTLCARWQSLRCVLQLHQAPICAIECISCAGRLCRALGTVSGRNDAGFPLRCSCAQLKHAKLARQLESATTAEKAASERVEELQEELQDCSSTCRSRMRWLEQAAADAARRTQQLYRCLQNAAPLEVCVTLARAKQQSAVLLSIVVLLSIFAHLLFLRSLCLCKNVGLRCCALTCLYVKKTPHIVWHRLTKP